jgi:4-hydroxybenzoate polyprenyltransferase
MKWLKELRVSHYLKNVLIFVPAFFGGVLTEEQNIKMMLVAFLCFCMGASAIYLVNDIKDIEKDRLHPVKCKRPVAAGDISVVSAGAVSIVFIVCAYVTLLISGAGQHAVIVFSAYLVINCLYSIFGCKNIPLADITILVGGFYLRVLMGAVVTHVQMSPWLSLVIITGAGFLAFGKRRNEQRIVGETTRSVLKAYPPGFLDRAMYSCMTMANVFFALWCILEKSEGYWVLFPIVLLICFKYSMDLEQEQNQGDPMDVILHDKCLIMLGLTAGVIMIAFLYVGGK